MMSQSNFKNMPASPDDSASNVLKASAVLEATAVPEAATVRADSPLSIAPTPQLSGRGLLWLLLLVSLLPLVSLSVYAIFFGSAADRSLPVEVSLDKRAVSSLGDRGAVLTDVVIIDNLADHPIPNLTVNLNGQYFLYQDAPLDVAQSLVLPQQIFKTKANQVFVPGRYPIEAVTVTGRLPSGARGVAEVHFLADQRVP